MPDDVKTPAVASPKSIPERDAEQATESFAAKVDTLFAKHFADTRLGHHTDLWNAVQAFKTDVIALGDR